MLTLFAFMNDLDMLAGAKSNLSPIHLTYRVLGQAIWGGGGAFYRKN